MGLMLILHKQTRAGRESGGDDETPDIDGNDGMTLMGSINKQGQGGKVAAMMG